MAAARISGVRIAGIASAVPDQVHLPEEFFERFGKDEVQKVVASTGVYKRYLAPPGMCTSDLCQAAANRLISAGKWDRSSIDAIIFLSQSPDYSLPFTAAIVQRRLGLASECAAFDVNLGCSGYVYGLWLAGSLIAGGGMRRVLLLMGDTSTHVSEEDKSVALIFGDAGTATLLDKTDEPGDFVFTLGTDGRGEKNLIIPAGRCRKPSDAATRLRNSDKDGNRRSLEELYMNGAEIFAFTLAEVPKTVRNVLVASGRTIETIDSIVLHQANRFILEYLGKRMKIPMNKIPLSLGEFGNTSSASIPLTMTHCLRDALSQRKMDLLLCGFGVGYSWGAVSCSVGEIIMPEMVFLALDKIERETEI